MSRPIRILALDGGGIRGVVNARLLAHLEERLDGAAQDWFDVMAGTSTGALIAAGLAAPIDQGLDRQRAHLFVDAYRDAALEIFPHRRTVTRMLRELPLRPKPSRSLDQLLGTYIGDARLTDAAVDVVIPAYDVANREVVLFMRGEARRNGDVATLLADAARASAAAPTYLPRVESTWNGRRCELADGGVFANDPALMTVLMLQRRDPSRRLRMLSLGTGKSASLPPGKPRNIALALGGFLEMIFDANARMAEQSVCELLARDHLRIDYSFTNGRPRLDDGRPDVVAAILEAADREWAARGDEIEQFVRQS